VLKPPQSNAELIARYLVSRLFPDFLKPIGPIEKP
jgi:hypothetical protein